MATLFRSLGSRTYPGLLAVATIMTLVQPAPVAAQGAGGLGGAIFALPFSTPPRQTVIAGRLYGGSIASTIDDGDDNQQNFTDRDRMRSFVISSIGTPGRQLTFPGGNRTAFNDWVRSNAPELLGILFPTSLSASVSGRDSAQIHAQDFLLDVALSIDSRRGESSAGGTVEYEWYERDDRLSGDSAGAWRGLYKFERQHLSVDGRFARQRSDSLATRATTVGVTFHPSRVINEAADWRLGLTARSSLLFSQSDAMNLGSVDMGAGVWTSARKDFRRVRIGFGALLQGTNTYIPGAFVSDDFAFLADSINARAVEYDVAYGTVLGYALGDRVSLNAKLMETRGISSEFERPASHLILAGVSYLVGGITPVDVGYKVSSSGNLDTRSLFLQGRFGW